MILHLFKLFIYFHPLSILMFSLLPSSSYEFNIMWNSPSNIHKRFTFCQFSHFPRFSSAFSFIRGQLFFSFSFLFCLNLHARKNFNSISLSPSLSPYPPHSPHDLHAQYFIFNFFITDTLLRSIIGKESFMDLIKHCSVHTLSDFVIFF